MMAKEASTLDVLSGGRFELGLGAGAFWDAIDAMGGPRRTPGESIAALEEAIAIIRQAWSGVRSVQLDGKHYRVHGYHPGPPPAHDIEIWIGAYKPRMLRLIGRLADGWLPSLGRMGIEDLAAMQEIIDGAARHAGRDPAEIRRMLNLSGSIDEAAPPHGGMTGSVDYWVETLSGWSTGIGIDTFIMWPAVPDPRQIEMFGTEVAPSVRAEVERRRSATA
jgi:alkanesulfonate monooxygenase SsuD/methylene tetrahydromethanopterin reductase-like flavin-dependent oxidoreductase (luciferase family)